MRCPRCKGCGHVPLTAKLQQVYNIVLLQGQTTTLEVAATLQLRSTTACNLLNALHREELVTRTRTGKGTEYQWTARAA